MSDLNALASMRQEHLLTLRATIEEVELVLRAQEERLKAMDAAAMALVQANTGLVPVFGRQPRRRSNRSRISPLTI